MKKIIICSSFYENGRKYLEDFFNSIHKVKLNNTQELILNIVVDDLLNPYFIIKKYSDKININLNITKEEHSITQIRNILIKSALDLQGDALIFIDMDDLISEDSLQTHLDALKNADISYGDMSIVDENKKYLDKNLFDNIDLPDFIEDYKPLLKGNFMGLSNTAIKTSSLKKYFLDVPKHLVATDWWLYTMLLYQGCTAKKTRLKVSSYRQHQSNVLGYNNNVNLENFISTCHIAEEHFESLPEIEDFKIALEQVRLVKKEAINNPLESLKLLKNEKNNRTIWFSDIFSVYNDMV